MTNFGPVLPGGSAITANDCVVGFGASNDTAMLRLYQQDHAYKAMNLDAWSSYSPAGSYNLDELDVVSPLEFWGVAASGGGEVARTTNGGATWTKTPIVGETGLTVALAVASSRIAWIVTSTGEIWKTADYGATFSAQASGTSTMLNDIDAANEQVAWAVGSVNTVRGTTDGGTTWSSMDVTGGIGAWNAVESVDSLTVWAVGVSGQAAVSTDGGATWTRSILPGGSYGASVAPRSATEAWAGQGNGAVSHTSNGGATWTSVALPGAGSTGVDAVEYVGANVVRAGTNNGRVYTSNDGGATWTSDVEAIGCCIKDIEAIDARTAILSTSSMYRSPWNGPADYLDNGTADWDTPGSVNLFGACLRDAALGANAGGSAWQEGPGNACPASDGLHWNAIPAAPPGVKVADTTAADGEDPGPANDPEARLRFGVRMKTDQAPGAYIAPIAFDVVAPSV